MEENGGLFPIVNYLLRQLVTFPAFLKPFPGLRDTEQDCGKAFLAFWSRVLVKQGMSGRHLLAATLPPDHQTGFLNQRALLCQTFPFIGSESDDHLPLSLSDWLADVLETWMTKLWLINEKADSKVNVASIYSISFNPMARVCTRMWWLDDSSVHFVN